MREFQFQENRTAPVKIAGEVYQIPLDPKRIQDMGNLLLQKSREIEARQEEKEGLEDFYQACQKALDSLLGPGSFDRIFQGREQSWLDVLDLLHFLIPAAREALEEEARRYLPESIDKAEA